LNQWFRWSRGETERHMPPDLFALDLDL
jgi:hypothetical protein